MRMVRCLLAIALVFGVNGVSRADTLDFHMVVLDPFATTPIFTAPFSFSFDTCVVGQLPTNVHNSYEGCFSGVNRTGQDWVGLQLVFSNTAPLGSQPAGCALDGSTDYFQNATCALTPNGLQYILSFTTGAIPNNGGFVIAEDGVEPSLFPLISATVTVATPEPNSIWLLSAGVLMVGVHFGSQRRWAFRVPRL
jgi:hypothetical protein